MRFVIVGNGAAGNAAARAILRRRPGSEITIISSEKHHYYSRVLTSYYISGKVSGQEIFLQAVGGPGVRRLHPRNVVAVSPGEGLVILEGGEEIPYDRLLLATGSHPVTPDIPGIRLPGVFTLRTLDDAVAIREWAKGIRAAVVLGAGMVGLKAAEALFNLGLKVMVVASSARVLSQALDAESAAVVQRHLEKAGVELRLGSDAVEIAGRDRVEYVRLKSGEVLEAGAVLVGKGVTPNTSLAGGIPIKVNRGIVVDQFLQTSVPGIYAAGDVCEAFDAVAGRAAVNALWTNAVKQGAVAGENMAGGSMRYDGSTAGNSFGFGKLYVIAVGRPSGDETCEVLSRRSPNGYRRVVLKNSRIIGAVEVGEGHSIGILRAKLPGTGIPYRRAKALAEAFVRGNLSFAHVIVQSGAAGR